MDDPLPRLVILRGSSASGKTTLGRELQRELGPGTANIGQDHFRRVVLAEHDIAGGDNIGLIGSTVHYCLDLGRDVVLEGILLAAHYGPMLRKVVADHAGPTHVFYLDVPLEETLRRHEARPLRATVSPERLRDWHVPSDLLGVDGEVVVDATGDVGSVVQALLRSIGPVVERTGVDVARFL